MKIGKFYTKLKYSSQISKFKIIWLNSIGIQSFDVLYREIFKLKNLFLNVIMNSCSPRIIDKYRVELTRKKCKPPFCCTVFILRCTSHICAILLGPGTSFYRKKFLQSYWTCYVFPSLFHHKLYFTFPSKFQHKLYKKKQL